MSTYLGDFLRGAIIRVPMNTSAGDGASINPSAYGTVEVFADSSETAITAGVTVLNDHSTRDGTHMTLVDTSNAAYVAGVHYTVKRHTMTVDGKSVSAFVGAFSLQRATSMKPVVGIAQGGAVGYVDLPASASSANGDYAGAIVRVRHAGGTVEVRAQGVTGYVGATRRFSVSPAFAIAPDSTSEVELFLAPVAPTDAPPSVNVATMSANALTASALATDAVSEIQTGLPTAATVAAIKAITDTLSLQAIGQEVLLCLVMARGNRVETQGLELVAFGTDGTTEIARQPFVRSSVAVNPPSSIG